MNQKIYLGILFFLCSTGVMAQPSNDQPCNSIALTTDGVPAMFNNEGAGTDEDEVSPPNTSENCDTEWCDEELNNTVWFSFIAPASGTVTISTCTEDNEVDTQIAVWDVDDCLNYSTYALLAANDDVLDGCSSGSSDYASELTLCGLVAGTTYLIQVDAYGGEEGVLSISVATQVDCNMALNLQVIHNSADVALATVDVRLNGTLIADNLSYRQATAMVPVIGLNSGVLTINAASSADSSNSIFHETVSFMNGVNHVAVIKGIHSASGYNTNVNNVTPGFEFFQFPANTMNEEVLLAAVNGVTDAAPVNFQFGADVIFTGLSYGEVTGGPLSGSAQSTLFNADSSVTYGIFTTDLTPYLGQSVVVLLTGFADPGTNSNGAPYGMCVVTSAGGSFTCLNNLILGIDEEILAGEVAIYPNPVSEICTIDFETLAQKEVEIQVYDLAGNLLQSVKPGQTGVGKQAVELNMQGLASGMYMVNILLNGQTAARQKLQLLR